MAKHLIQDIIIAKKQLPRLAEKTPKESAKKAEAKEFLKEKKPKRKLLILGFIGLVIAIFASIIILNKFSSLIVEITPRQEFIDVEMKIIAAIEPRKNELPAEVMSVSRKEKGSLKSMGIKQISRKASGQIVIYNTYSSDSQPLVKNTRFETPDGKIYRIDKSIVVPGTKVSEGKIIAGEIEVTIFADQPGFEYNIGLTDFTISGFKNSVKYEKIYGRSKSEIKGGFVGEASVITENDISGLQSQLREKIKEYLFKIGVNPKPDEFLLYDNARQIVFEERKNGPKAGDEADVLEFEENGTIFGFLLKKSDISRALAEKYLSPEVAPQAKLINPDKLSFELKNFTPASITFVIKGKAHFIWKIDENRVKNDLITERKNPETVFQKYSAIDKAKIVFKPSWWPFIPKKAEQIAIRQILKEGP